MPKYLFERPPGLPGLLRSSEGRQQGSGLDASFFRALSLLVDESEDGRE
jgi:hypothetical protein